MPAALPIDREKVKMVAIQVGVREAARAFELPESTVLTWSQEEGWFRQVAETQAIVEARRELRSVPIRDGSSVMQKYEGKTKLYSAKVCYLTAKQLASKKGDELLSLTGANRDNVATAAKLHNWQQPGNQPLININLTGQRFDKAE